MRRGEIHWAELFLRSGSDQTGKRPAIVMSHDGFNGNAAWQSMIVVPVTTSPSQARRGLTVIAPPDAGLPKSSFAVCHQATTLDRSELKKFFGSLSGEKLRDIEEGLRAALDLE